MLLCLERLQGTLENPVSKSVCFQEESCVQEGILDGKNAAAGRAFATQTLHLSSGVSLRCQSQALKVKQTCAAAH